VLADVHADDRSRGVVAVVIGVAGGGSGGRSGLDIPVADHGV
jgi:hypothetical protein